MTVNQLYIDLINLPKSVLSSIAIDNGIGVTNRDKWDLARMLSTATTREAIEEKIGRYLYAGTTSMSWFRLEPEEAEEGVVDSGRLTGEALEADDVRAAIIATSDHDPFDANDRPELSAKPQLVVAYEQDDAFFFTFGRRKRLSHVLHDYQQHPVEEDQFFGGHVRLADGTFEVRGNSGSAHALSTTWLADFAVQLDRQLIKVNILESEVRDLATELGGHCAAFAGKDGTQTSSIATHKIGKANHTTDFFGDPEYEAVAGPLEPVQHDLVFDFDGNADVRAHISHLQGSIWVKTNVPEVVLNHVYESLKTVKSNAG